MEIELSDEERCELIIALRTTATRLYEDAWRNYGPHGRAPNPDAHRALMNMGDRAIRLAVKFGDEDPDSKEIANGEATSSYTSGGLRPPAG